MPGYIEIAHTKDIPKNGMKLFEVKGEKILIVDVEGKLYAVEDRCPHFGYPLYLGELDGKILKCGFHYNKFDVTTGEALGPVTHEPLKTFEIKIQDSIISIKL